MLIYEGVTEDYSTFFRINWINRPDIYNNLSGKNSMFTFVPEQSVQKVLAKVNIPFTLVYDGQNIKIGSGNLDIEQKTLNDDMTVTFEKVKESLISKDHITINLPINDFIDGLSGLLSVSDFIRFNFTDKKLLLSSMDDISRVNVSINIENNITKSEVYNLKIFFSFIKLFNLTKLECWVFDDISPVIFHGECDNAEFFFVQAAVS